MEIQNMKLVENNYLKKNKVKIRKIVREYKTATNKEVLGGCKR
jgi:hypothetical protein